MDPVGSQSALLRSGSHALTQETLACSLSPTPSLAGFESAGELLGLSLPSQIVLPPEAGRLSISRDWQCHRIETAQDILRSPSL